MFKANIITKNNGVGLFADYQLISNLLKGKYEVNFIDINNPVNKYKADISIFLEHAKPEYLHLAGCNILIPNPEWFEFHWKNNLHRFDIIMCKTHDGYNIFSRLSDKCVYTSFTSIDCYLPEIERERTFFHNRGRSSFKGTLALIRAWSNEMGRLIINSADTLPNRTGIMLNTKRLSFDNLKILMNACYFHVCTSEAEGFGHYINEARSCGAVIITTNASPMKEFINGNGMLVDYNRTAPHMLGTLYYVDYMKIRHTMEQCLMLSDAQLREMSNKSRELFLQNDKFFKKTFLSLL